MVWDDDLEQLALDVANTFGDQALRDAMHRALRVADTRSVRSRTSGVVFEAGQLESALRDELRKLLRPQ
jgi:hypothetical protein